MHWETAVRDLQSTTLMAGIGSTGENEESRARTLEDIYDAYARSLYRYAYAITRSAEDAEDVLQEVFGRIASEKRCPACAEATRSYLFTAVRNASYSVLRSRHRRRELASAWAGDADMTCGDASDSIIQSQLMRHAFGALPTEQREVLVLKVYDQMSFKEIAEAVGASISTVASRYRYAIAKLREALEGDEYGR